MNEPQRTDEETAQRQEAGQGTAPQAENAGAHPPTGSGEAAPPAYGPARSTDEARAQFALRQLLPDPTRSVKIDRDYRALVRRLPGLVRSSGLAQALTFLASKAERGNAHDRLGKQLAVWLCKTPAALAHPGLPIYPLESGKANITILARQVVQGGDPAARRARIEVLALAAWLKRWVEAIEKSSTLTSPDDSDDDPEGKSEEAADPVTRPAGDPQARTSAAERRKELERMLNDGE